MNIEKLEISGIGGIKELKLNFHQGFNALCGPNGIGKTTILKIIVNAFTSQTYMLKRHASCNKGQYKIHYNANGSSQSKQVTIKEFAPQKREGNINTNDNTPYIMYFRENRSIEYMELENIPKDIHKDKYQVANQLEYGIDISDMKGWFDNRFLFSSHKGSLTDVQMANTELAKKSISVLDETVAFKTVDAKSLDIILTSRNGDIYFEYLSAGYKSCVYIIMGLIKEIEYRFENKDAKDFNGVVLIDEIDLHLHPIWQAKLVEALKKLFPLAQFITTTHSPSVLQTLKKEEIIPLTQDENGNVRIKELNLTEYGLQGWTIEEILRDVMEMPETTSTLYENTKRDFDRAMNTDQVELAKGKYEILKKMLHPDSVIRRLIDIQFAGLESD